MAKLALPGPVISLLLLFFFLGGSGPPLPQEKEDTWCVSKPGTPNSALQNIINFACGILKEWSEIQEHGSCYFPNTLINHATFAMNLNYKTDGRYDEGSRLDPTVLMAIDEGSPMPSSVNSQTSQNSTLSNGYNSNLLQYLPHIQYTYGS
ncbi:unnamed protein product [Prunus armeniaca]